jgi:hypothetical protein
MNPDTAALTMAVHYFQRGLGILRERRSSVPG